jgi:hypothetical protein
VEHAWLRTAVCRAEVRRQLARRDLPRRRRHRGATHHYWSNVHTLKGIGSGLLATVLWPLIFLGIDLHVQ